MAIDYEISEIVIDKTGRQSPTVWINIFDDNNPETILSRPSVYYNGNFRSSIANKVAKFTDEYNAQKLLEQEIKTAFETAKSNIVALKS